MRFADQVAWLRNEVIPVIRAHGWYCHGYDQPSGQLAGAITYTAGLTEAGVPELAIVGLPHEPAAVMLNFLARLHLEREFVAGVRVPMPNATELEMVDAPGIIGPIARALYGRRVRFVQALWPDMAGRYPTDGGWAHDLARQVPYVDPLPGYLMPAQDGVVGVLDERAHQQLRP